MSESPKRKPEGSSEDASLSPEVKMKPTATSKDESESPEVKMKPEAMSKGESESPEVKMKPTAMSKDESESPEVKMKPEAFECDDASKFFNGTVSRSAHGMGSSLCEEATPEAIEDAPEVSYVEVVVHFFSKIGSPIAVSLPSRKLLVPDVKTEIIKCLQLSQESLELFGLFNGSKGMTSILYTDTSAIDLSESSDSSRSQLTLQRLSFDPDREETLMANDPKAVQLIFWEVLDNKKCDMFIPNPTNAQNEEMDEMLKSALDNVEQMKQFLDYVRINFHEYYCHGYLRVDGCVFKGKRLLKCVPEVVMDAKISAIIGYNKIVFLHTDENGTRFPIVFPWVRVRAITRHPESRMTTFEVLIKDDGEDYQNILRLVPLKSERFDFLFSVTRYIMLKHTLDTPPMDDETTAADATPDATETTTAKKKKKKKKKSTPAGPGTTSQEDTLDEGGASTSTAATASTSAAPTAPGHPSTSTAGIASTSAAPTPPGRPSSSTASAPGPSSTSTAANAPGDPPTGDTSATAKKKKKKKKKTTLSADPADTTQELDEDTAGEDASTSTSATGTSTSAGATGTGAATTSTTSKKKSTSAAAVLSGPGTSQEDTTDDGGASGQ